MTSTGPGAQPAGTNLFGAEPWARRGEQQAAIAANTIPVGVINAYYGTVAPAGWLLCDGTGFSAATYPQLAAILGGSTLPNLKGRVVVGLDVGQVEFDVLGETGGEKAHTLTIAEMPSHQHAHNNTTGEGGTAQANRHVFASGGTTNAGGITTDPTGSGGSHNNLPPYLALSYIIKAG